MEVWIDDVQVGKTGDLSRLPDYMNPVDLHEVDADRASKIFGSILAPGKYTPKDGDKYHAAMAATFKGTRVQARLFP
jgi:hypothetical protein